MRTIRLPHAVLLGAFVVAGAVLARPVHTDTQWPSPHLQERAVWYPKGDPNVYRGFDITAVVDFIGGIVKGKCEALPGDHVFYNLSQYSMNVDVPFSGATVPAQIMVGQSFSVHQTPQPGDVFVMWGQPVGTQAPTPVQPPNAQNPYGWVKVPPSTPMLEFFFSYPSAPPIPAGSRGWWATQEIPRCDWVNKPGKSCWEPLPEFMSTHPQS